MVHDSEDPTEPRLRMISRQGLVSEAPQLRQASGFQEDEPTNPSIMLELPRVRMPDLGALNPLMTDGEITEIMINDLRNVVIEKNGKMAAANVKIQGIDELNRLTRNILDMTGGILSPDQPYLDVMLPDGSRANIVGPPLTLNGPCLTIRKFPQKQYKIDDLVNEGTLDRRIAYFLNVMVVGRMNLLISGGTGSGKTTLLSALIQLIPQSERIVMIEDTAEIPLAHANSVRLQTKPATAASQPVTARDLVVNSLRMRPDRVIIGECRRGEAYDVLQAMNTGHTGSMTTLHANSPKDALTRMETLSLMGAPNMPLLAVKRQMAEAIDLVIQLKRLRNGKRKISSIIEVTGMEGEQLTLQEIFLLEGERFRSTGFVPRITERLREQGFEFPSGYFG